MAKLIAYDEEARRGLERGMNQLADAVKVTLGPQSMAQLFIRPSFQLLLMVKPHRTAQFTSYTWSFLDPISQQLRFAVCPADVPHVPPA